MTKKVVIISSSLRTGSNSEILAREAARGAAEAGNEVEFISLKDKDIRFCKGCLACQKTMKCVIRDDMNDLIEKIRTADALIFATPIYYYELSGQLKTFLDRCNPLYPAKNNFRDVYLITTAYDDAENASETAVKGMQAWITCFEQSRLAETLFGGGLEAPKDASKHTALLEKAYALGKNI